LKIFEFFAGACANDCAGRNSKYEARNPKQIQITKIQNSKQNFSHKSASEIGGIFRDGIGQQTSGNDAGVVRDDIGLSAAADAETTPQVSIKRASVFWFIAFSHREHREHREFF